MSLVQMVDANGKVIAVTDGQTGKVLGMDGEELTKEQLKELLRVEKR